MIPARKMAPSADDLKDHVTAIWDYLETWIWDQDKVPVFHQQRYWLFKVIGLCLPSLMLRVWSKLSADFSGEHRQHPRSSWSRRVMPVELTPLSSASSTSPAGPRQSVQLVRQGARYRTEWRSVTSRPHRLW